MQRKVRRDAGGDRARPILGDRGQIFQALVGRLLQQPAFDHLRQNDVTPLGRIQRVAIRVVARDRRQHADELGALNRVQFGCARRVKRLSSRLDAVRVVAELNRVEVHLDDLTLGVVALDLDARQPLPHLTCDGLLEADIAVQVARQLLCQRRSALGFKAGNVEFGHHGLADRRERAKQVDAPMLVKAVIFGRDERRRDIGRYTVVRRPRAVLEHVVARQLLPVGGVRDGGERDVRLDDVLIWRVRRRQVDQKERDYQHAREDGACYPR